MQSNLYRSIELLIIFVLVPVRFAMPYSPWIKLGIGLAGFIYVILVLLRVEKNKFKLARNLNWKEFWKRTFLHLLFIVIITITYVWFSDKTQLFNVMLGNSKLWLFILFFYSAFSVYPQELIYRTFFFQRYQILFKNDKLLIFVNAILFSLAHIFFGNTLVMFLTFIGGIMFAHTFYKTKSTLMVSIEHAIYGCWLFTVGMGSMLGFPS
ncbi:MAG: CPBP family intramembrane metalloprotease [Flavobacteriaceae bacterium]|nr:CPBP family intramembrane metalloprotease [Bacteroidia bacterium]NND10947.1 CPBP family intramembrane metalloprotease [Flavobacteriaceae bacterium]NNL60294.1 CPBP family intramembrane metalloprotease [Flavobacteriaceae bacterium]RZV54603.1 MAG: CPBP family intramembrane metalloprotease [Flavobacteriaceae bacterium]